MAEEHAIADETMGVAHLPSATNDPTPTPLSAHDTFFADLHSALQAAGVDVTISEVRVDANDIGVLAFIDASLARAREAAGVILYSDDGRTWTHLGSGTDGESVYHALLSVTPYPAEETTK